MRSSDTARDPIELEIFKNIHQSIAEEMGAALRVRIETPDGGGRGK
jgi:N-methylhydantoinase B/oxoprolinase/acetone carboxylase alpha subunit